MSGAERINRILDRHARSMTLVHDNEGADINAVIQPLRYKNKMYLDSQYTKLGIVDESCFLFICSAEHEIDEYYDFIVDGNTMYSFVKVERVNMLGNAAYTWAIIRIRS